MKGKTKSKRIREIVSVFVKYGIKEGLKGINDPVKVRKALEELGPTFVKIGQMLSTRPDIMPENFMREFQKLQDEVRPVSFETVKSVVESTFNKKLGELFLSFNEEPLASASLSQVHHAVLGNGDKVVVKVLRPGVGDTILNDLAILRKLTPFLGLTPQGQVVNPREVVEELMKSVKNEVDFIHEAGNMLQFCENQKDVPCIICPNVYEELVAADILVMEYIEGIKVTDTDRLKREGYDPHEIAFRLTQNYLKQIFEDGFFHADPHPGNLLVSEGKIVFLDFGLMGTISKSVRLKFNSILSGIASRDIDVISRSILRIGVRKGNVDTRRLYSDIEDIYNQFIEESLRDIELPAMLDEIIRACRRNNLSMPREITMFIKGMMTMEGVVRRLDPDLNVMDVAIPYVKQQILKKRNLKKDVDEQLENLYLLSKTGLKIPVKFLELINSALAGKLKVQMEHTNLEKSIGELNRMVNRIVFGIIVAAFIIASSLVIRQDTGPKVFSISTLGLLGYAAAGIMGIWLLVSILRSGKM